MGYNWFENFQKNGQETQSTIFLKKDVRVTVQTKGITGRFQIYVTRSLCLTQLHVRFR